MPICRALRPFLYLTLAVAPATVSGQTATQALDLTSVAGRSGSSRFEHHQRLRARYDSLADSTHLELVTHKGLYFIWIQHPRLAWTLDYAGRTPGEQPPATIILTFRTQDPQSPSHNRLLIEFGQGERIEASSVSASTVAGPMTSNLFMRIPIPTAELARALESDQMRLSVGGIGVSFTPEQMEALRDLLSRAGAWPADPVPGGSR
jgi:hypothetical protein